MLIVFFLAPFYTHPTKRGGSCAEYESNAAWCGGYGEMGESGLTPNENCCVCKSKLASSVSAAVTTSPSKHN